MILNNKQKGNKKKCFPYNKVLALNKLLKEELSRTLSRKSKAVIAAFHGMKSVS